MNKQDFLEKSKIFFGLNEKENSNGINVLLIEDNAFIIDAILEISYDLVPNHLVNIEVIKTKKGILNILSSNNNFDVVFLDGNLEDGDTKDLGEELVKKYKKVISISACKIITGKHLEDGIEKSIEKTDVPFEIKEIFDNKKET